jgi:hypothetical protein
MESPQSNQGPAHAIFYPVTGATGPVLLLLTDNIAAIFSTQYSPISMTVSNLALGPLGWLLRTGFFLFGILLIVETIGLKQSIRSGRLLSAAIFVFIAIGLGFFLLGIFNTDPQGETHTLHGLIHINVARTVALLFPIACVLSGLAFRADPNWKGLFKYTAFAAAIALTLDIIRLAMPSHWAWIGLYERLIIWNGVTWLELTAVRFWQITNRQRKTRSTPWSLRTDEGACKAD